MKKIEYARDVLLSDKLMETLKEMGDVGWELVVANRVSVKEELDDEGWGKPGYELIFKRK